MITQAELKKWVDYDKDTGLFTWLLDGHAANSKGRIGKQAGSKSDRYLTIWLEGKNYGAHRLAWLYEYGKFPDNCIDHKNGITNDNRIDNLRDVTHKENAMNRGMSKNNTSGETGICWYKRKEKWHVRLYIKGKQKHIGYYNCFEKAIRARDKAYEKAGFTTRHYKGNNFGK